MTEEEPFTRRGAKLQSSRTLPVIGSTSLSKRLMNSAATTAVFGLLVQKIVAGLTDRLGASIERFRAGFLSNFSKIAVFAMGNRIYARD